MEGREGGREGGRQGGREEWEGTGDGGGNVLFTVVFPHLHHRAWGNRSAHSFIASHRKCCFALLEEQRLGAGDLQVASYGEHATEKGIGVFDACGNVSASAVCENVKLIL